LPDLWYDADVALAEVPVNIMPLLDSTDFVTREVAVAYNQAGMDLVWNFCATAGAMTQTAVTPTTGGLHDWAHQGDGMYSIEIPASGGTINNDTEGFGWFTGFATGVLPWRGPIIGFRAAGLNALLIDSAYSATRGLSGTALPAAAADAAGGLPISDAGGLDSDNNVANALTAYDPPTKTEMDTAHALLATPAQVATELGTYDGPTKAEMDIAHALLTTPAQVATELATYDGPTKTEMDTGHALLATATALATVQVDLDNPDQYKASVAGLATAANQTTILNRIGAFTGTGVNTLLGFFRALLSKDAATPSDVGGTFAPAADSTEAISEAVATIDPDAITDAMLDEPTVDHQIAGSVGKAITDASSAGDPWSTALPGAYVAGTAGNIIGNLVSKFWSNVTRTLTQTAAQIRDALSGDRLTIHRGDDWSQSLTGLGSLAGRTELWFTVKQAEAHSDLSSYILITESEGLIRLNRAAAGTPANGSVTVDDETAGTITIVLAAVETAKLPVGKQMIYDVQVLSGGNIETLTESSLRVTADVTRATSA